LAVRADEFALPVVAHRRAGRPPIIGEARAAVCRALAILPWRAERRRPLPFAFAQPACGATLPGTTSGRVPGGAPSS
jgi:hypothetical protein